jgi:hypothetical protein
MTKSVSYSTRSVPTYYDDRLSDFCLRYGSVFQEVTLIEKFDILAAIGFWGGFCAENYPISLADYLIAYLDDMSNSDARDMLLELSEVYSSPSDAMGLCMCIASQIGEGIYLEVD